MKTLICLIILTISAPAYTFAQDRYGIILGGGRSNIDNYQNYDYFINHRGGPYKYNLNDNFYSPLFSWKAGVYYIKPLKIHGLEAEIEIVANGMGAHSFFQPDLPGPDSIIYESNDRFVYISIPLNLRYSFRDCWYLSAGFTTGILIKNLDKDIYYDSSRLIDFGANIAFGLTLFPKLDLEFQAYHGLIRKNLDGIENGYDYRLFNWSETISLKYELGQRK